MLLIVSNRDDLAADFMITRLEEKGIDYFRLDSEDAANLRYSDLPPFLGPLAT